MASGEAQSKGRRDGKKWRMATTWLRVIKGKFDGTVGIAHN
jgi:hypothetical protein